MSELFGEIKIGELTCKNRVVMSPMSLELGMVGGGVTSRQVAFFAARAKQEVGLIMAGSAAVSKEGRSTKRQFCFYNELLLPGVCELVKEVKQNGSKVGIQLMHAGRQAHPEIIKENAIAPSAVVCSITNITPQEMTKQDIENVITSFGETAVCAQNCGFDLIEIQFGNGFLLHNFLSPYTNLRTDDYGRSLENRMKFPMQVLEKVVGSVSIPVTVRVCAQEYVANGFTWQEAKQVCIEAQQRGAAAISLSMGSYDNLEYLVPTMLMPPTSIMEYAKELRKSVTVPVIAGSKIGSLKEMQEAIENGAVDMVAIGRSLIADEKLVAKAKQERHLEIRPCLWCNNGCIDSIAKGEAAACAVNPRASFELVRLTEKAKLARNIVVIGAGPAGIVAACTAAKRGHRVTLLESEKVGGALNMLANLPERGRVQDFQKYLENLLKICKVSVIEIELSSADDLEVLMPDAVIVAAGARQAIPPFPVREDADLEMAEDVLLDKVQVGQSVTVVGCGNVGLQTAKFLCSKGKEVHIVEMKQQIGNFAGTTVLPHEIRYLEKCGAKWHFGREVMAVKKGLVSLDKGTIETDSVVVALGYYPNIGCAQPVRNRYSEVYVVGDALAPRRIINAVSEGFEAGCAV